MKKDIYDSIIIGGGFYGLYIADFIASQGKESPVVRVRRLMHDSCQLQ